MPNTRLDLRDYGIDQILIITDILLIDPYASIGRFVVHMKNGLEYESDYFSEEGAILEGERLQRYIQDL